MKNRLGPPTRIPCESASSRHSGSAPGIDNKRREQRKVAHLSYQSTAIHGAEFVISDLRNRRSSGGRGSPVRQELAVGNIFGARAQSSFCRVRSATPERSPMGSIRAADRRGLGLLWENAPQGENISEMRTDIVQRSRMVRSGGTFICQFWFMAVAWMVFMRCSSFAASSLRPKLRRAVAWLVSVGTRMGLSVPYCFSRMARR